MIQKVFRERPVVKHIGTGTADSNTPMLAIKRKLGFAFYNSTIVWQLNMARLEAYLKGA